MKNTKNPYIVQTAIDYDMSYLEVERIYDLYRKKGQFHEKLEEFIKERSK